MFTIIGLVIVIGSVLGGFTIAGGSIPVLFQVSEIIVICGTALGTVFISTPLEVLMRMVNRVINLFSPSPFNKGLYLDALKLLFELFQTARRDGLVAIESHIENPDKSPVFKKYPAILKQHHAMEFLSDSLRLVLMGSVPPYDLESLMDGEIEVHHEAETRPVSALQKVGDALPGIGIVAAVLGIVVTMGSIAGPVEEIGHHVAAALTGTFLGVLLAYGFLGPLSSGMEAVNQAETRFYNVLKAGVVAFAKGFSPIVAVEFARRAIFADQRPSFTEMEQSVKGKAKS
ncbi:MAG: flagellar motor stator protein MotA [Candidatus Eisenbacteria bacterium]|uniref:Flagellar motor stator protein MotA n=1 Tax=Eiseniibacteriota bacterium TaxID=2212470 RepID=A0A849SVW8_UNCEI|nr:flagellar motor stator protein MotA [Candidatus Eisenbacteria bacterium]